MYLGGLRLEIGREHACGGGLKLIENEAQYRRYGLISGWSKVLEHRSIVLRYPHRYPERFRRARAQAGKRAQVIVFTRQYLVLPEGIELSTSPLPTAGRGTPGNAMG